MIIVKNMANRVATVTAIGTLIGMVFYASTFAWGVTHAQYAKADAVDYLFQKHVELDIWRYEDEIEKLQGIKDQLKKHEPEGAAVKRATRRIAKLQKRLDRLDIKLEGFEQ